MYSLNYTITAYSFMKLPNRQFSQTPVSQLPIADSQFEIYLFVFISVLSTKIVNIISTGTSTWAYMLAIIIMLRIKAENFADCSQQLLLVFALQFIFLLPFLQLVRSFPHSSDCRLQMEFWRCEPTILIEYHFFVLAGDTEIRCYMK